MFVYTLFIGRCFQKFYLCVRKNSKLRHNIYYINYNVLLFKIKIRNIIVYMIPTLHKSFNIVMCIKTLIPIFLVFRNL